MRPSTATTARTFRTTTGNSDGYQGATPWSGGLKLLQRFGRCSRPLPVTTGQSSYPANESRKTGRNTCPGARQPRPKAAKEVLQRLSLVARLKQTPRNNKI